MKTCTCPHEATRNGFLRTGYNSLCPFHGKPLPSVAAFGAAPVVEPPPREPVVVREFEPCEDCGARHGPGVRCDYVDET